MCRPQAWHMPVHGLLYCRDLGLQCPTINTSCAQAYTLQQEAIATGAKVVVVLICIPGQALTHVRWAAAEQPRMCMCSQHMIEVLYGAMPCRALSLCMPQRFSCRRILRFGQLKHFTTLPAPH